MKVEFTVANAVKQHVGVSSTVEGEETRALVEGLEVELVSVLSRHGSMTLRFFGKELAEASELFQKDRKVNVEISA